MRLVIQQAVSIVGLELGRDGLASETERRLTRQVLLDAQVGGDPGAAARSLQPFGIDGDVCVLIFAASGGAFPERALQAALAAERLCAAVATQPIDGRELLCAIVEPGDRDPVEIAAATRAALGRRSAAGPRPRPRARRRDQWERAAKQLHCHRHTLRYRIEKIEGLTGRDLAGSTDRIEFWLALRARELIA